MLISTLLPDRAEPYRLLVVGAHPDDAEIGAGATIMRLVAEHPTCTVRWLVFTGDEGRGEEARRSAAALVPGDRLELSVLGFRDGYLPWQGAEVKSAFADVASSLAPDLVLTHRLEDAHQDHRLIAELSWQVFRGALICEYEIPKWEGDLGQSEPVRARHARSSAAGRSLTWRSISPLSAEGTGSVPTRSGRRSGCAVSNRPRPPAWPRPSPVASCLSEPMRLLVTGHLGYIGAVLTPMLLEAGHDVVGLDADLYAACTFGDPAAPATVPTAAEGPPRRRARRSRRVRRRPPPGGAVQRSARRPGSRSHLRHQPPRSVRLAELATRGRRAALPLLVVVQQLRRRRRRTARRGRGAQPGHAVRHFEGARRARCCAAGR